MAGKEGVAWVQDCAWARPPRSSPREAGWLDESGCRLGRALRAGGVYTGAEKAPFGSPLQTADPARKLGSGGVCESRRCGVDPEGMGTGCPRTEDIKVEEMLPRGGRLEEGWRAREVLKPGGAPAP